MWQSLLSLYGSDDLSDTENESELPENPMSPEQIAFMLDRQIALTRELDVDDAPPRAKQSGGASGGALPEAPAAVEEPR